MKKVAIILAALVLVGCGESSEQEAVDLAQETAAAEVSVDATMAEGVTSSADMPTPGGGGAACRLQCKQERDKCEKKSKVCQDEFAGCMNDCVDF